MAPMIDMVFLLLVFFMCVSSMATADKSVELDLPNSAESKVPDDLSDRGIISINSQGEIFLGMEVVSATEMQAAVKKLIQEKGDSSIVLRADRTVEFRWIKDVLKDCAEVGAYEIVYATYEN